MKKIFILTVLLAACLGANAQPWLDNFQNKHIKLQEVVDAYETTNANPADEDEAEGEGKDNQFNRWLYFWQGRTDEDGYLVSPRKNWMELKKLQAKEAGNRSQSKTTSPDVNWTFHGPTNPLAANYGIGRLNVIEFHPTDTATYLIGSPGGGLWRTTDDGSTWTVLSDFFPVLGVADIDYNPQNPRTIYVCTGDRDAGDTYSMGVFKSVDGGTTFDTTGFQYPSNVQKKTNGLVVNPLDTNSLTLATSDGIYKSFDGGATWALKFSGFFQQLLAHPTDTSILYAAGSTSSVVNVFRSSDGGTTWQASTGIASGLRRLEIAVTKADPAIVKVVAAKSDYGLEGIYNSTDTGKTFTKIFDDGTNCATNILASTPKGNACEGQGWYDLSIQISPTDPNNVIVGGVNTWFSTTGGSSWKIANQWNSTVAGVTQVHADKHYHKFHPFNTGTLYECNDGGLFKTSAPMSSNGIWNNLSEGLGITQFYRNAVSDVATYVLGGAQDNGSKMLVGGTSRQMTGADGMECQMDPADSNVLYTSQQYGELRRSVDGGAKFTDIQKNIPGTPKGAWITPFLIHPYGRNILLAAYNYVYLSADYGDTWNAISPDFFTNMSRIAVTAMDDKYVYTATITSSGSALRYTTDLGTNWKTLNSISPFTGTNVSDIMVDPKHKDSLWVTFHSFSTTKVAVVDIKTNKWTVRDANLPDVPVNCIAFDGPNQTFYIGTDLGVFYMEYNDTTWSYFNNNTLPNVEVFDLGINATTNTLWAATYGRGMWSSPTHKSTTGISNTIPLAADVITIAPNPNYGSFNIKTGNPLLRDKYSTVRIINMAGVVAWKNEIQINGNGHADIKADLARGTYMVEIIRDNTVFAKTKMVVF